MGDYVRSNQSGTVKGVASTGTGFGGGSTTNTSTGSSSTANKTNTYFTDQKKGEVNELKQLLRNVSAERDLKKRRDVIKKVIAYMTLGVDVSRLFTEMIMAIETKDLVIKKMVYLYLCTYAHTNPEMAIMCVNTLQRDCSNEDPMVRGLALRSLCSLRLPTILEYMSESIQKGLEDTNAYVRKTAVMATLKLNYLAPQIIDELGIVVQLYEMIRDPDPQVSTNCLLALDEMHASKGGMSLNRPIVLNLLNRLDTFNEWGLCKVISLLSRYEPVEEEEMFSIMNLLDPVLRMNSCGIVLAVIKCFFNMTKALPEFQRQVYERARGPLLTLVAASGPESVHCLLSHILVMVQRESGIFDEEYRQFYVRSNDSVEVSRTKVSILTLLATRDTASEIIAELAEYICGVDAELSRRAVRAIGEICRRVPDGEEIGIARLLELLDVEAGYIRSEAALAIRDLLRKRPNLCDQVFPSLLRSLRTMDDEPEGKAAIIWMIGMYGSSLKESPYLLESVIDGYTDEASVEVKLHLLTAVMKLFLKRPPEVRHMLGRLLCMAVDDLSSQDLHDRALLYYRLLRLDVRAAERVLGSSPPESSTFSFFEDRDTSRLDAIFEEFDTLAIVYSEPSDSFTLPAYRISRLVPPPYVSPIDQLEKEAAYHTAPESSEPPQQMSGSVDLLRVGEAEEDQPDPKFGLLNPGPSMSASQFQAMWTELGDGISVQKRLRGSLASTTVVEESMEKNYIRTMASGNKNGTMRFFFYAYGAGLEVHLIQCIASANSGRLDVLIKSTSSDKQGTLDALGSIIFEAFDIV